MKLLRALFRRKTVEAEMAEELQSHLQARAEHLMHSGLSPEEANRQARLEFGSLEKYKEECRESLGVRLFDELKADLRYALRSMRHNRGFTAVIVCCLALGIGANTALFSVVSAVLLNSLPVKNPQQLLLLDWGSNKPLPKGVRSGAVGYGLSLPYLIFEQASHNRQLLNRLGLSGILGYTPLGVNRENADVVVDGRPGMASGELVTGTYFHALGLSPGIGRLIAKTDISPSAPRVVVLSYGYWSRRFGRNPAVLGKTLLINNAPSTVIGVAAPKFSGLNRGVPADLWLPLRDDPLLPPWGFKGTFKKQSWWLNIFVRRKPDLSDRQVQAALTTYFHRIITAKLHKHFDAGDLPYIKVRSASGGMDFLQQGHSKQLFILMAAVGLVLLIACANVATLLLSRAAGRQREIGIRLATGASLGRLIRQLLTESILLAIFGGVLGLLFVPSASHALFSLLAGPQPMAVDVHTGTFVLGFTAGVSILTGILFGLAPALKATRVELAATLKESAASFSRRSIGTKSLVAAQVALSLLLLVGAGLFLRTLSNLENQNLGFEENNVLLFTLDGRNDGYSGARLAVLYGQILQKIQTVPGVRSATESNFAFLGGWSFNAPITTDGGALHSGKGVYVPHTGVGPNFVKTMGMKLLFGRDMSKRDIAGQRKVAIVNKTFAHYFYGALNPLGHRFNFSDRADPAHEFQIVGVVQDARDESLRGELDPAVYIPFTVGNIDTLGSLAFEVRTAREPQAFIPAIRSAVHAVDPRLPLIHLTTQRRVLDRNLQNEHTLADLSTLFSALALLLASIGLYGNLSYAIARRTNEIGIRMALGASRTAVVWMILRESLLLIAIGIAIGLPLALAAARLIQSTLYGVSFFSPAIFVIAILVLVGAAMLAAFLPARRASRIDPLTALRYE